MTKAYIYLILIIMSFLWTSLAYLPLGSDASRARDTNVQLENTKHHILEFESKYGRFPQDMGELRAYIKSIDGSYVPYDSWGSRLKYLLVSKQWFYLKSFGADLMENQIASEPDLNIDNIDPLPSEPPSLLTNQGSALHVYPGPVLYGLKSPTNALVAQLSVDQESNAKRLIIRDLADKDFLLSSFHDKVQEYYWTSTGDRLVFTASGSYRYEDGIYIWDLNTNRIINIIELMKRHFAKLKSEKLYMALSTVDSESRRIFVFLKPMRDLMLDPSEFYSTKNLYSFRWDDTENIPIDLESYQTASATVFDKSLTPTTMLESEFSGSQAQQAWLALPFTGEITGVLEKWQDYCVTYHRSPVFPYALFWLASLYGESVAQLQSKNQEQAFVLRNYGIEIAQALDDQITAPEYLRAMALYIKYQLQNNQRLSFSFTRLQP